MPKFCFHLWRKIAEKLTIWNHVTEDKLWFAYDHREFKTSDEQDYLQMLIVIIDCDHIYDA